MTFPTSGSGDVSRYATLDDDPDPSFFVHLMDEFRAVPDIVALKRAMSDALQPGPGRSLLDVGCGTGDDVLALAARLLPGGTAVGLDHSTVMLAEARRRSAMSQLPVEFHAGNACSLPFEDDRFDACRAERTLVHVVDPALAVTEMVRVTRPGGRVVLFEGEIATLDGTVGDPELATRINDCFNRRLLNSWVAGRLARICDTAGLVDIEARPFPVTIPFACYRPMVSGLLQQAVSSGDITSTDLASFFDAVALAEREGSPGARARGWLVSGRIPG